MNGIEAYTRVISRLSKQLGKLLDEDFPADMELRRKTDSALMQLHYAILGAFLEKGQD